MNTTRSCPVGKLGKILLATDGFEFSEGAVREAINFAGKCGSRLYAMMVVETNPEYESMAPQLVERAIEQGAKQHLESIKARAIEQGVECEIIIAQGEDPYQYIVNEAVERQADMIIIGRRGRKGLTKLLMGEVAAKIEYRNLLVATDGSMHSAAALTEAIAIAKRCGSHLIALSAMRDESEREEAKNYAGKAVELAQKQGVSAEAVTPRGRSFNAIVETAGGRGVDLIVMGAYGKTRVKKLLMGSSTEKVIGNAGCAVLVVKA